MVSHSVNRRSRVHRDREAHRLTNATVGSRSHRDGSHDRSDTLVDGSESVDVAFTLGGKADGLVVVHPAEGSAFDSARESDGLGHSTVANHLVSHSVNRRSRVHRDREGQSLTLAAHTFEGVSRSHSHVSDKDHVGGVDTGESGDVTHAFCVKTDFGVVVRPSVGHVLVSDVAGEFNGSDFFTVADHLVGNFFHDGSRVHRDGECHRLADAGDTIINIGGNHADVGDREGATHVDCFKGSDVAFTFGGKTDGLVVVGPSVGHFTVGGGVSEDNLSDLVTIANHDGFNSDHDRSRVHRDGEHLGAADARITIVDQGRSHREVGDSHFIAGVDGFKGIDIAFAFSDKADGHVIVGPVIGDGAFFRIDGGGEFDGGSEVTIANHLVFRLIHNHVLDLELSIFRNEHQAGGIGSSTRDAADGQGVDAFHASTLHLEGEDSAFVAFVLSEASIEDINSEDVVSEHIAEDLPTLTSTLGKSQRARDEGQVLTKGDVHLGSGDIVVIGQFDRDSDDVIEISIIVSADGEGVNTGLDVLCANGHVIVRHDKLPRFLGNHFFFAVVGDSDVTDTKARIRGGKHRDGFLPSTNFSRVSGKLAVLRIQHCDVVVGREDRDGEADRLTNAANFFIGIGGGHRDSGDDSLRDQLIDSSEGGDVAFAAGGETNLGVVVLPSVGHFTVFQRSREDNLVDEVAVVDFDVIHSIHETGRIHRDGELEGAADAGVAIMHQGGGHREVSHDSLGTFVDGGEGGDVAGTFSGQADGGVVVGPSVGDFTFGFSDLAGESDSGGGSLVADHLAFRLVHLHIEDLELTVADTDFQLRSVGGTDDEATDSQLVDADDAGASHLEGEDGAFVAYIIIFHEVEGRHFKSVARKHVASDGPAVRGLVFSAVAESQ